MRALPAPPVARQAAAQSSMQQPTLTYTQRYGRIGRGQDAKFLLGYNDFQPLARRFARQVGAAAFTANVIADCCARCDLFVEEQLEPDGEWTRSEDPAFAGIMGAYRNPLQSPEELVYLHGWHYQVAGEMMQVEYEGPSGAMVYGIYSVAAIEWDQPRPGMATVKLAPDGKVDNGTAFVVPREQVRRFWNPDQEWQSFATSPMAATIDDLRRWRALARYAGRTADSALAMNGILWAPEGPFMTPPADDDDDGSIGAIVSQMQQHYYDAAKLRLNEDDDVASIAPYLAHWDKEDGPPEWIKIGEGLDPEGIAHRKEALEDFARGTNMPVTSVVGGGVGDANHWSEWLASDKFIESGVAPTMNRITHLDLTRSYLWPRAQLVGYDPSRLQQIRIGYDATPVIVKQDQSQIALELNRAGLLSNEATLRAANFDPDSDAMLDQADRDWLLQVIAKSKQGSSIFGGGGKVGKAIPAGPANVVQGPPERPMVPPANGNGNGTGAPPVVRAASVSRSRVAEVLGEALLAVAADEHDYV